MASIAQGLRFGLAGAAVSALALALAGCSGESTRFNDNPFSANGGPEATGSVPAAPTPSAIMQANNLTAPANIYAGQQLVIPRYAQATRVPPPASRVAASPPKTAPAVVAPAGNGAVHIVAAGDTLSKISRLYRKPVSEIVKANNIAITTRLNVGDRIVIPGVKSSAANPNHQSVAQTSPAAPVPQATEATPSASVFTPASAVTSVGDTGKTVDATASLPKFRWPANGRVITAFGPMTNGKQNEGINIAVTEN